MSIKCRTKLSLWGRDLNVGSQDGRHIRIHWTKGALSFMEHFLSDEHVPRGQYYKLGL